MIHISSQIRQAKQAFKEDSLFRNAAFLIASTAVMSVLGFGFWLFIAHLYPPSQIGEASTLISITTLISNISLLGLNAGLVRFLPGSKNQSRDINAAIVTVGLVTMLATVAYLLISGLFGVHISLLATQWHKFAFVALMAAVSLNTLTDAVFVANRRAEYHTAVYAIFGLVKLILPIFLIPFGSLGVFMAYMSAVIVSLAVSLLFMKRVSSYKLTARPNWDVLKRTRKFATNNYIGVILAGLPAQLMPLFIIKHLGSADVAFFSMAWTMANLLYVVPSAASQSLLAESSHDPLQKAKNVRRTVKLLTAILIPVILLSIVVAPYLLQIFGAQYAKGSTLIFQIFAVSTIFITISTIRNTVLNIEHRSGGIVVAQAGALVTIVLSVNFLFRYGLPGVGLSLLLGGIASNICHYIIYKYNRSHPSKHRDRHDPAIEADKSALLFAPTQQSLTTLLKAYGIVNFAFKELANGSSSRTLLIKHDQRLDVLRVYKKNQRTRQEIQAEIDFTNYLIQQGLPVPRIAQNVHGAGISQAVVDGIEWQYVLMGFERGAHPVHYSAPIIYDMARKQAHIHVHGQTYAKERQALSNSSSEFKQGWLRELPPLRFAPKGFSHFDFDASNVLTDEQKITSILDFEGMRYGSLVACVFFTLTRIYDAHPDMASLQLYLTAYQQVRVLNFIEKRILNCALFLRYKAPKLLFVRI